MRHRRRASGDRGPGGGDGRADHPHAARRSGGRHRDTRAAQGASRAGRGPVMGRCHRDQRLPVAGAGHQAGQGLRHASAPVLRPCPRQDFAGSSPAEAQPGGADGVTRRARCAVSDTAIPARGAAPLHPLRRARGGKL